MVDKIALALVIVGALNWGSIGIFQYDLVAAIGGGQDALLARIIYSLVAVAGLWCISFFVKPNDVLVSDMMTGNLTEDDKTHRV